MTKGHLQRNDLAFASLVNDEEEFFRWQSEKINLIAQTLRGLSPRGTVADVGCFTGLATKIYLETGFNHAVGFDASREALAKVKEKGLEGRYWLAGIDACPASDSEFDVVVAADIIEHIVDTDFFVSELKRITKAKGHLIVTTPNLAFWLSRLRMLFGRTGWSYPAASPTVRSDINIDLNHIRINTRREWQALFESQSLIVEDVKGWSLMHAYGGLRARKFLDRQMTRKPELAFGLLFLLRLTGK